MRTRFSMGNIYGFIDGGTVEYSSAGRPAVLYGWMEHRLADRYRMTTISIGNRVLPGMCPRREDRRRAARVMESADAVKTDAFAGGGTRAETKQQVNRVLYLTAWRAGMMPGVRAYRFARVQVGPICSSLVLEGFRVRLSSDRDHRGPAALRRGEIRFAVFVKQSMGVPLTAAIEEEVQGWKHPNIRTWVFKNIPGCWCCGASRNCAIFGCRFRAAAVRWVPSWSTPAVSSRLRSLTTSMLVWRGVRG
jgi:hypothetical protein